MNLTTPPPTDTEAFDAYTARFPEFSTPGYIRSGREAGDLAAILRHAFQAGVAHGEAKQQHRDCMSVINAFWPPP